MRIGTDVIGLTINNLQRLNGNNLRTNFERLSSGLRINKGADDPSGLAISSGMKAQIRGLNVAMQNVQDGISLLRLQDGALAETHDMLMRMRDVTVRGANEATLTQEDRDRMQIELDALALEITRKAVATTFNTKKVLIGEDVPGGYKISFYTNSAGSRIFIMNADGSEQVELQPGQNNYSAISPDGTKIAYTSANQIWIMDNDGQNPIQITNTGMNTSPSWSPDGSRIMFRSNRDGNDEIYFMNADGSDQTRITNNPASDTLAQWSPDGSRFVFRSNRDGNNEIYIMDIDGQNLVRLTNTPGDAERYSTWSPDGKQVAFDRNGGADGVFVINDDGTGEYNVSPGGLVNDWFPDGGKILFQGWYGVGTDIFSVNVNGTNRTNITNNAVAQNNGMGDVGSPGPDEQVLQIGPDNGIQYRISVTFRDMRAMALGVSGVSVLRQQAAQAGIDLVNSAIETVSNYRSEIGQVNRRLEHIAGDLAASDINISAANSRIEDADMAEEATEYTKELIKEQSTTAMAVHSRSLYQSAQTLIGVIENA